MTTGNTSYYYSSVINSPLNGDPEGTQYVLASWGNKTWNGGDAIGAGTPRTIYRTRQQSPRNQRRGRNFLLANLPPQNYSVQKGQFSTGLHAIYREATEDFMGMVGTLPGEYNTYDDPAKYYQAVAELQAQIYGSGFQPSVFLGEGQQALHMISNAATRLRLALTALKRFNPRGVLQALGVSAPSKAWSVNLKKLGLPGARRRGSQTSIVKGLSSLWIEVNYGWLPLLGDAEAGAQWIATALNSSDYRPNIVIRKSWKNVGGLTNPDTPAYVVCSRHTQYRKLTLRVYAAQQVNGFLPNLISPLSVAWELLPWSFVIDWFAPIGSYLSALSTARDITGLFVVTQSWDDYYTDPICNIAGHRYAGLRAGVEIQHQYRMTRSVSDTLPVVSPLTGFFNKSQGYKSWRHAMNAVALLSKKLI